MNRNIASTVPVPDPDADPLDIDTNRRRLNRYRYIERQVMHVLAGWLPKTARFELKSEIGRVIWEDSHHVNALYLRLREIQSPAFQRPKDPGLILLMDELINAPDEFSMAIGVWQVIKPALRAALEEHERATFPNSDRPSVYAIEHIRYDVQAQWARMDELIRTFAAEGRITPATQIWKNYVSALLADAGGVSGDEPRPKVPATPSALRKIFTPAREAARDERFTNMGMAPSIWGATPGESDYEAHSSWEFERYSTEMLAAETVAQVMHLLPNLPWELHFDLARHLYDEVRHGLMGYEWMRLHGADPFAAPQATAIFKWRSQFSPVEQYCMLTMGNEASGFPYRVRRLEAHKQGGNRLNEQFVRYDMADESQHVRFGRRWLPEMIKLTGEKRTSEQFIEDVLKIWQAEYANGLLPIQPE